jgi:hypothetical protein
MYTGSDSNLVDLQAQINLLTGRLTSVDGVGIISPAKGSVPALQATVAGMKSTMNQSVLQMQQLYLDLQAAITVYINLFKSKFGIS